MVRACLMCEIMANCIVVCMALLYSCLALLLGRYFSRSLRSWTLIAINGQAGVRGPGPLCVVESGAGTQTTLLHVAAYKQYNLCCSGRGPALADTCSRVA